MLGQNAKLRSVEKQMVKGIWKDAVSQTFCPRTISYFSGTI